MPGKKKEVYVQVGSLLALDGAKVVPHGAQENIQKSHMCSLIALPLPNSR